MDTLLPRLLEHLEGAAHRRGLSAREWAEGADLRPETLARLKHRDDCDLSTLGALAGAVDLRLELTPRLPRDMPARFGREEEEALLLLCASGSLDLRRWLAAGPRYFMAGLAVLVAGMREADREGLLLLGEALYPGMSQVEVFRDWMAQSPLRPSRFLPMLRQRATISANTVARRG